MSTYTTADLRSWLVSNGHADPVTYAPVAGHEAAVYTAAAMQDVTAAELDAAFAVPAGTVAGFIASRGWAPLGGTTSGRVQVVNPAPAPVVQSPAPAPAPVTVTVVTPVAASVSSVSQQEPSTAQIRAHLIGKGYLSTALQVINARGIYQEAVAYNVGSDALALALNMSGPDVRAWIVDQSLRPLPRDVLLGVQYPQRSTAAPPPATQVHSTSVTPSWLTQPQTYPDGTVIGEGPVPGALGANTKIMLAGGLVLGLMLLRRGRG